MATKKLVLITLVDNKEWVLQKAEELNVEVHRYYETTGRSEFGDYEATAFVVSGINCMGLANELSALDEFGY